MENEVVNVEDNFGKEVGKAFLMSTAASAGVFAGMALVGLALAKIQSRKMARQPETTQEED